MTPAEAAALSEPLGTLVYRGDNASIVTAGTLSGHPYWRTYSLAFHTNGAVSLVYVGGDITPPDDWDMEATGGTEAS